ncbi:unnamed protein product [Macrosiphum euphorbiae]|uniref:Uncharacterized protein n=1 Tax=Macrosiphum euphorbiae TaxID=13131 RepID=A0AAV0XB78_9HEMI|nr:unnamed protein product [Macrosiphum euphorbiae]
MTINLNGPNLQDKHVATLDPSAIAVKTVQPCRWHGRSDSTASLDDRNLVEAKKRLSAEGPRLTTWFFSTPYVHVSYSPVVCEISLDVATVPEMDIRSACDDTVQTETLTMPVACEVSVDVPTVPEMDIRAACDDTVQAEILTMPIVNASQPDTVQVVITGKTGKPRCRLFWSGIKKNVRRALCCGCV